jgi:hypothetical protein
LIATNCVSGSRGVTINSNYFSIFANRNPLDLYQSKNWTNRSAVSRSLHTVMMDVTEMTYYESALADVPKNENEKGTTILSGSDLNSRMRNCRSRSMVQLCVQLEGV